MLFFESLIRFWFTMKKVYLLFPLLLFVFITCEDENSEINNINDGGYITIELPDCPPLENIDEENLCTADDGTNGVKILGECYSVENTTAIIGPFGTAASPKSSGPIPKEIALLKNLEIFYSNNYWGTTKFSGEIPAEICNLTNLIKLILSWNELTGSIPPEIGHLTKLIKLKLDRNELTGEIPPTIGNLVELRNLGSSFNNHTGIIPQEIGNLTKLHTLDFTRNELTGPIPSNIGNLKNLGLWDPEYYNVDFESEIWIAFDLSHNNLTGPLPASIGDLDELAYVDLSYNQIDGPIPPEMGDMEFLVYMNLLNNQLNGKIPPELGNLNSLGLLWLGYNNLRGPIPEELCNVNVCNSGVVCNSSSNIFRSNNLCPPWPDCFENFLTSEGIIFDRTMQHTQVCNMYPECADGYADVANPPPFNDGQIYDGLCLYQGDIDVLQDFVDVNDSLTGDPLAIGSQYWYESVDGNYRLSILNLNDLYITEIPETIVNLTELKTIDFSGTPMISIPPIIYDLTNLKKLIWENGQLTGSIPPEIGNLTQLTQLRLNHNQLTGPIPPEIVNIENLHYLWLNNNQLTGEIPLEMWYINSDQLFGDYNKLRLQLRHNQLTGVIPDEVCDLNLGWNYYDYVDIRNNKFCPPYPSCLTGRMGSQNTSDCD